MAKPVLNAPQFQTEQAAFAYVEARLWPNGPVCPHCQEETRIGRLNGKTTRPGPPQVLRLQKALYGADRHASSRTATFPCICGCKSSTCFALARKASRRGKFSGCSIAA